MLIHSPNAVFKNQEKADKTVTGLCQKNLNKKVKCWVPPWKQIKTPNTGIEGRRGFY